MPTRRLSLLAAIALTAPCVEAQEPSPAHVTIRPSEIVWREGRGGVASAVLAGDPSAEVGTYTLALRLTDGAWIPPHFHPLTKQVVVLSGTLLMGLGDSVVVERATPLGAGSFSVVPANTHHFEGGRGETVILLYGVGPLRTIFVDTRGNPLPR